MTSRDGLRRTITTLRWLSAIFGVWGLIGVGFVVSDASNRVEGGIGVGRALSIWLQLGIPVVIASAVFAIGAWVLDLLDELASYARGDGAESFDPPSDATPSRRWGGTPRASAVGIVVAAAWTIDASASEHFTCAPKGVERCASSSNQHCSSWETRCAPCGASPGSHRNWALASWVLRA
jgi:hypothetical protein